MPFGLVLAPATFQRCMISLLGHLKFVKVYLDDILVHSKTITEHKEHLKTVFKILKDNTAEINFDKSKFCQNEVRYLGRVIDKNGIRPDLARINNFKIPLINTKKNLQKLLGLLNWFKPFIKNFSINIEPLYQKLEKNNFKKPNEDDIKLIGAIVEEIKKDTYSTL